MALIEKLENIGNAIRNKTGKTDLLTLDEMVTEIGNIETGGGSGEGSGDLDWSAIGYEGTPQYIKDNYDYAVEIQNNWTPATSLQNKFKDDKNIIIMPIVDTSNTTNFNSMFYACTNLKTIPLLDTSKGTNIESMFQSCTNLEYVPALNISSAPSLRYCFNGCNNLKTIPLLDTSNITNFNATFQDCKKIETVPQLDTSKGTNMYSMFYGCTNLKSIPLLDTGKATAINRVTNSCTKLETIGGFLNLGKGYTQNSSNNSSYGLDLSSNNSLTHDSLMNVINNLYDLNLTYDVANSGTLYTQQLILGSTNIGKLNSSELELATSKGWTVL